MPDPNPTQWKVVEMLHGNTPIYDVIDAASFATVASCDDEDVATRIVAAVNAMDKYMGEDYWLGDDEERLQCADDMERDYSKALNDA